MAIRKLLLCTGPFQHLQKCKQECLLLGPCANRALQTMAGISWGSVTRTFKNLHSDQACQAHLQGLTDNFMVHSWTEVYMSITHVVLLGSLAYEAADRSKARWSFS